MDIVLKCGSVFYYDLDRLDASSKQLFQAMHGDAGYRYADFKRDVSQWLSGQFGVDYDPGQKAIRIKGRGNRREADVLPCVNLRRYTRFTGGGVNDAYIEGVCFFLPDNTQIVNFPQLHRENCIAKNQATKGYFKPMVRIIKNMRNRMRADYIIADGLAPSYYLEGLLWNVPSELFGQSYERTFIQCYSWLHYSDKTTLVCANQQAPLLRANDPTSWDPANFDAFMAALAKFWDAGV